MAGLSGYFEHQTVGKAECRAASEVLERIRNDRWLLKREAGVIQKHFDGGGKARLGSPGCCGLVLWHHARFLQESSDAVRSKNGAADSQAKG